MNKLFSQSDSPILFEIVDEVHQQLVGNCDRYTENTYTIYIAPWTQVQARMPAWENTIRRGFAICSSNHFYDYDFVRLIILNIEECTHSQIDNAEYKALILHEMGHLMNSPIFEPEPTMLYCFQESLKYDLVRHEHVKLVNAQNDEIYADYYAKRFGFGAQLISTFNKHHLRFNNLVGHHDLRVEKINGNEVFEGIVRPIDRNGF